MSLENKLQKAINSKKPEKIEIVFEEIYYEYGKLVGFIISKYILKKEDIEELVDDVFVSFSKAMLKSDINNIKYYLSIVFIFPFILYHSFSKISMYKYIIKF